MQAVIMAAGKGTRFNQITQTIPKPLIEVQGLPILERTLTNLPETIDEVIIVIGHLGEKIQKRFGSRFKNFKLTYVAQNQLSGTAAALWSAQTALRQEKFLVLNGDDLYSQTDLRKCLKEKLALAVYLYKAAEISSYHAVKEKKGYFAGLYQPTARQLQRGILVVTGAYVLDCRIFDYEPVQLKSGEYGLPQTIAQMAKDQPVKLVKMNFWLPINSPENLKYAEKVLRLSTGTN